MYSLRVVHGHLSGGAATPRPYRAAHPADVLLVDATNVLARSSADRQRWAHAGHTLQQGFRDWLAYLHHATAPGLTVAVFDPPKARACGWLLENPIGTAGMQEADASRRGPPPQATAARGPAAPHSRESASEAYLRRRKRRRAELPGQVASTGDPLYPYKAAVGEFGASLCLEAPRGRSADDCIGAVCSILQSELCVQPPACAALCCTACSPAAHRVRCVPCSSHLQAAWTRRPQP